MYQKKHKFTVKLQGTSHMSEVEILVLAMKTGDTCCSHFFPKIHHVLCMFWCKEQCFYSA